MVVPLTLRDTVGYHSANRERHSPRRRVKGRNEVFVIVQTRVPGSPEVDPVADHEIRQARRTRHRESAGANGASGARRARHGPRRDGIILVLDHQTRLARIDIRRQGRNQGRCTADGQLTHALVVLVGACAIARIDGAIRGDAHLSVFRSEEVDRECRAWIDPKMVVSVDEALDRCSDHRSVRVVTYGRRGVPGSRACRSGTCNAVSQHRGAQHHEHERRNTCAAATEPETPTSAMKHHELPFSVMD